MAHVFRNEYLREANQLITKADHHIIDGNYVEGIRTSTEAIKEILDAIDVIAS